MFNESDAEKAYAGADFEQVERYPAILYGHRLDDNGVYWMCNGYRELLKCRKCGNYVLLQYHFMKDPYDDGCGDIEDIVIYPVDSPDDADVINRMYEGLLEHKLDRLHLVRSWCETGDFITGEEKTDYYFLDGTGHNQAKVCGEKIEGKYSK